MISGKIGLGIIQTSAKMAKIGLRRQPPVARGINPSLTFLPSGKTFELPRFASVEMQQAQRMNKIATQQIRNPQSSTFAKATVEDLNRLTSTKLEDTFSRVQWTNPKDGKVYHLLKQGKTEDGKIIIRILDKDGAFVKETAIEPKKIAIIDSKCHGLSVENPTNIPEIDELTHINAVELFARRNNPFAEYEVIDAGTPIIGSKFSYLDENKVINEIQRLQSRNDVNYLNCSFGQDVLSADKTLASENTLKISEELDKLADKGVRVLQASGNGDGGSIVKRTYSAGLLNSKKVEGVGALTDKGGISSFSGSRSSRYTQHYEQGEFTLNITPDGVNITGLPGTDIAFSEKNPFVGKTLGRIRRFLDSRPQEYQLINKYGYEEGSRLYRELSEKYKKYDDFINQVHFPNARYECDSDAIAALNLQQLRIEGTSFSAPARTAKLALNDMMEGIL